MATEQTAQKARAEAGAVADTVKEETKNVAQQAQEQASTALQQVQRDVRERANDEASKFAQTLRDTSRQLRSMAGAAGEQQGLPKTLVQEGAEATERLATRLDDGGIDAVLADIRSWARRQPGAFLLGAAAAGFVTGRLVRNLNGSSGDGSSNTGNGHRALPASSELSNRLDPGVGIGGAE